MLTGRAHLVEDGGLKRLLERHLYRLLEEAALPIHVVGSDMMTGDEVLLSSDNAVDALCASQCLEPEHGLVERLRHDDAEARRTEPPCDRRLRLRLRLTRRTNAQE